jgi:hypothetical protein
MAQLGDLPRARVLIRRAARAFPPTEAVARARCAVAEAEIALAARELSWPGKALDAAQATLAARGDRVNAAHAGVLAVRRLLLIGRIDAAKAALARLDPAGLPPALRATHALVAGGIALRRLHIGAARTAFAAAARAARDAGIMALTAEVETAQALLAAPAARLVAPGTERMLDLDGVAALLGSGALVVDACRLVVRAGDVVVSLGRRPVLFALARALAASWPGDASRAALLARAFRARHADESHRARLRVEIGRLRRLLRPLADVRATPAGFALAPRGQRTVAVLAQPIEDPNAPLLACLADGQPWSSSALALALGASQRTVQRGLDALAAAGRVQGFGRGRARRWVTPPLPGFTTALLLPAPLAGG